jgi:NifU-like protein involved in Fe-S cluster formation
MDDILYREEILERYHAARYRGRLERPDLHAELDNPLCGDRIRLELAVGSGRRIGRVLFDGHGCVISQVAASLLAERLEGIGVDEARRLSADEAVQLLGIRLSPMRLNCGLLAWRVLQRALDARVGATHHALGDDVDKRAPATGVAVPSSHDGSAAAAAAELAETIYRRYFLGAIVVALTAGASWGAWLLWTIALHGSFRSVSLSSINAHGEAQIFGWVGLFIMGFAYQVFPRLWQTSLAVPRMAAWVFMLVVAGLVVRTIAITAAEAWPWSPAIALAGGALLLAAVLIFTGQILATLLRSRANLEPYVGFVAAALGWFVASSVLSGWHTWNTMTARSVDALIWYVATYQSPLRELQIHGLALFMILGVSLRMLPGFYEVPRVPDQRAWRALVLLVGAVFGEVALFLAARWTGNRNFSACLPLPWTMLALGCGMIVLPWRPWRPFPVHDRSAKFVRAAYGWLAISLGMLWISPAYQYAYQQFAGARGLPFSHAYHGAIRHAITVGFISLMIMGIAARVVPTLNGIDYRKLSALHGPFLLVNVGCLLRVVMQTLTDWWAGVYPLLGASGTLEVAGLAWWGLGLVHIIVCRQPRDHHHAITAAHRAAIPSDSNLATIEIGVKR